jgi:hypothetical protein
MAPQEASLHAIANCERPDLVGKVVFVHGLDGDARATWTSAGGFWPQWIGVTFSTVGIWSLSYPAASSAWTGASLSLPRRAKNVLELLRLNGLSNHPLTFVVHSLGGLLAKTLLRTARTSNSAEWDRIARNVRGVLFLATPHSGSMAASIHNVLRVVTRSTAAIEDLRRESPYMEDLNDWFRSNFSALNLKAHVLREGQDTCGIRIVEPSSSDPGIPDVRVIDTDSDHVSICKPRDEKSFVYVTTVDFIRRTLFAPTSQSPGKPPQESSAFPTSAAPVSVTTHGNRESTQRTDEGSTVNLYGIGRVKVSAELEDVLTLAQNQSRRDGKAVTSTRYVFAAIKRLNPELLREMIDVMNKDDALPDTPSFDKLPPPTLLDSDLAFSNCITESLTQLRIEARNTPAVSVADLFVDVAKYGKGASVERLRDHGYDADRIDEMVSKLRVKVDVRRHVA